MQVDYTILNPQIVSPPGTLKPRAPHTNSLVSLEDFEAKSSRKAES